MGWEDLERMSWSDDEERGAGEGCDCVDCAGCRVQSVCATYYERLVEFVCNPERRRSGRGASVVGGGGVSGGGVRMEWTDYEECYVCADVMECRDSVLRGDGILRECPYGYAELTECEVERRGSVGGCCDKQLHGERD